MSKPTERDEISALVADFTTARAAFLTHADDLFNRLIDAANDSSEGTTVEVYTKANSYLRPMEKAFHRLIIAARKHDALTTKSTRAETGSAVAAERERVRKAARKTERATERNAQRTEQITEPASDEPEDVRDDDAP